VTFDDLPERPPFLLTMADYYGTLAAVRCLGRAGLPVTVAEGKWLAPARWSKYVTRRVPCPPVSDTEAFLSWLMEFGQREPGHVLYPTSDDMAFLYALHKDALSKHFRLYQPGVEAIYGLLNKEKLQRACEAVGLATPRTVFPKSLDEVRELAATLQYPLLIKPRTQILFKNHIKGAQVTGPSELVGLYDEFVRKNEYGQKVAEHDPDVALPMLQAFHVEAAQNIYSLSGFAAPREGLFVARAAVKVLQRPRRLGIGLCFEHAEVDAEVARQVEAVCQAVGYHGVFEVELIRAGGKLLLIDFNPRFYSQMNFEIARGLPLPVMVYLAALGETERLKSVVHQARAFTHSNAAAYCHRFIFEVLLRAQGMSGKLSGEEIRYWREWHAQRGEAVTDAVLDAADVLPAVVDAFTHLRGYARHPRAFLRTIVLDR
jgi:D-aspartate ligase